MKVIMAVTGLAMIGYLVMHMFGNLKAFLGAEEFDNYAHWLKGDLGYPLLPKGWFIWIFRAVMLIVIVLHIWSAAWLTRQARAARGTKYVHRASMQQTYAARTMRWGGVILVLFLVFHILQFTAMVVRTGFAANATPYQAFVVSFSQWWLVLLYAVWLVAVCLHVRHGFWSAFATLGANTSPKARLILNGVAYTVAVLLFVGFLMAPVAALIGVIN